MSRRKLGVNRGDFTSKTFSEFSTPLPFDDSPPLSPTQTHFETETDPVEDRQMAMERSFKQFETLLDAVALLCGEDCLIDQVYTVAIETAVDERLLKLMAEAMHKKWLADTNFPPIAVRLCLQMAEISVEDVSFRSIIYSLVHNDYQDRIGLRKISRQLFCNSAHFALEFFRFFRSSDSNSVFNVLIEPVFDYLFLLIDPIASDMELALFHYLMFVNGPLLQTLNPTRMATLIMDVRRRMIDVEMLPRYRALMLELIEVYTANWNVARLPPPAVKLFLRHRPRDYAINRGTHDRAYLGEVRTEFD